MLDETNHVPVVPVTAANYGEPVLTALKALIANETWAQEVAKAGQHLAQEILHPDNIDRSIPSNPTPKNCAICTSLLGQAIVETLLASLNWVAVQSSDGFC